MTKIADGEFLYIFNDDIFMRTYGWEEIVEQYSGQFCILAHDTFLLDNSPAVKNNSGTAITFTGKFNGNPIFPKTWVDICGYVSQFNMVDSWFYDILQLLNYNNINIEKWVDIKCECDRPDGNFGSYEVDLTFLEGRQHLSWERDFDLMNICARKIINYLTNDTMNGTFKVLTENPIALTSNDHIYPVGTKNDNSSNPKFILELEQFFNKKINVIDLGCSGGLFVKELNQLGHCAIGLEGSDYSIKNNRAEWPALHNKSLFTCDITKPFTIKYDNKLFRADIITAWEVLEHIDVNDLPALFSNIKAHLNETGIFIASINTVENTYNGIPIHRSVYSAEFWINKLLADFNVFEYPFKSAVRNEPNSFNVLLTL